VESPVAHVVGEHDHVPGSRKYFNSRNAIDERLQPLANGDGMRVQRILLAYGLFQIPGGWLADRFGPRVTLTAEGCVVVILHRDYSDCDSSISAVTTLRRSTRIDHLRSSKVTHTKNTICPQARKMASDIIHAEGVRSAIPSSAP
jgi:hypothetical protein